MSSEYPRPPIFICPMKKENVLVDKDGYFVAECPNPSCAYLPNGEKSGYITSPSESTEEELAEDVVSHIQPFCEAQAEQNLQRE